MPRYLVNLAMSMEVEAASADEAIEAAKATPIDEQRVYHTQTQELEQIIREGPWTTVIPDGAV